MGWSERFADWITSRRGIYSTGAVVLCTLVGYLIMGAVGLGDTVLATALGIIGTISAMVLAIGGMIIVIEGLSQSITERARREILEELRREEETP